VRTDQTPWHFLLNPAAGRGKGLRRWRKLLPMLQAALPLMTMEESSADEGMAALAETAVRAGKTHLVGVGGDGTHHDILNGIVRADGLEQVIYAPLPLGTGNDWVRTLRTPRKITSWLKMLRLQKTIDHRVGQLVYAPPLSLIPPASSSFRVTDNLPVSPDAAKSRSDERSPGLLSGPPKITYFLNVAGLAYDAEVVRRSEKARWKNRWLYPVFTLLYLKDFAPPTVEINYEDKTVTSPVHTINIGIGRYNGGGMRLVPQANPTADTLALTYAKRLPIWKILLSSWRFYTGSIGKVAEVTTTHTRLVTVVPVEGITALEADGELLGVAPITASLLNGFLRVVVH